ncbi:carboxypeptidase-like regulatory domain-containing protein [Croceitalea marina]|uniref:Carboxypeptidase-like regulatory domain-containing protein n=1 Tax=Croceitalea marina TaxID=1775166 RepID=A0ABW5N137_9FLAO
MSKKLLFSGLLLLSFFYHSRCISQSNEKTLVLSEILNELQERYGVQFNYASDLVENIILEAPKNNLSLEKALEKISSETYLDFIFISKTIITLKEKTIRFCGYSKDKDSNEILPFVTLYTGKNSTISNEEGFFELKNLKARDTITIEHIGYKPIRLAVNSLKTQEACETLFLTLYQEQLAEVVVYDFLVRGVDQLDNGSYQLDFKRFSTLPGLVDNDVLQSVQAFPGIQSIDETVSNINIRGGSNDQNRITWDGIKMYQSGHFFGLISMFNPSITQKVELKKNGSNTYETDGVSGTIAMKTSTKLNNDFKGSIGFNLIDAHSSVDTPLGEKASMQVAARKAINGFVQTPTYSSYFDRISQDTEIQQNTTMINESEIDFDFYDTSLRLLWQPTQKDQLRLNFIQTNNSLKFNETAIFNGQTEIRESNLNQSTIAAGLNYNRDWSEKLSTTVSIYNTDYKLDANNVAIEADQRFIQENKVSETEFRVMANYALSEQMSFIGGYDFTETKVTNLDNIDNPLFIRLVGELLQTHGVFSEVRLSSKDLDTKLTLGLRYNYLYDFNKGLWQPRLSFSHRFNENLSVEALGEFKHQSTSQVINFQNDFLGVEKRRWQLSNNESVPVITSKQGSIGMSYNKAGWLFNLVPFYKEVDGITTQSQGFQGPYEFERTFGSYSAFGADVLIRKQFEKNAFWLSYAYLDSQYSFQELPETSFANNFNISHAFTAGTNFTKGNWLWAAGLNWRSGRPFTALEVNNEVVEGELNFTNSNSERLKDYLRLDFSTQYQFNWGEQTRAQIAFSVWNVLNRENEINAFYRLNAEQQAQRFGQNSLGITPNLSVKLLFL